MKRLIFLTIACGLMLSIEANARTTCSCYVTISEKHGRDLFTQYLGEVSGTFKGLRCSAIALNYVGRISHYNTFDSYLVNCRRY